MTAIARQRLVSQQIAHSRLANPTEAVHFLGAVQAQDYLGAKWSLGLRIDQARDPDIERALNGGTIYRTWVVRGTLHFVAATDIHWMLSLLAPGVIASCARRYRELDLDEATFARTNAILVEALSDGVQLNRTTLMKILESHGIATTGQRAPYILQRASYDRLICQAATIRNDPTYQRLPAPTNTATVDPVDAPVELLRRYLKSRSPGTLADFGWWSGLPMVVIRRALESLKGELTPDTIDGVAYWRHRESRIMPSPDDSPRAYLLPGFDEYLLSYKDRSASMDMAHLRTLTPANGMLPSTMVYDGRVIGTWKRTLQKTSVVIAFSPYTPLTDDQTEAFAAASARYGDYIGLPIAS